MGSSDNIQTPSDKVKKALQWISETVQEHPDKDRRDILREAEIRFDLSPADCEFIDNNFA